MIKNLLVFILGLTAISQTFALPPFSIDGPATVSPGQTRTYAYEDGLLHIGQAWEVTGGTIISTYREDTYYTIDIHWGSAGTGTVAFKSFGTIIANKSVSIVCANAPTVTHAARCAPGIITLTASGASTGSSYKWYTVSTGGSPISGQSSSSYTTPYLEATTTYYVSILASSGCETPRIPITATVNPIPDIPTGQSANIFGTSSVTLNTQPSVNGNTVRWYTAPSGGTVVYSGNQYTTPTLTETTNYFASSYSTVTLCESSSRLQISINVYPQPVIASSSPGFISEGVLKVLSVANFAFDTYQWIDQTGNDIEDATSSSYSAGQQGNYRVRVAKGSGSFTSNPFWVSSFQHDLLTPELNRNFVISNTVLINAVKTASDVFGLSVNQNTQTIQYFDGLGRPIQSVNTQGSPLKKDIVQPVEYDEFGRESKKYLLYVHNASNGWYKEDAIDEQSSFYNPNNPADKVFGDAAPYALTVFEPSPLNRVLKQGAPGSVWQPGSDATNLEEDYTIKQRYHFNTATDEVLLWKYDAVTQMVSAKDGSGQLQYYGVNQLYANKTYDEQNRLVIEYVDKEGRTLLKRVQAVSGINPAINDTNYASTYYVYDDFGNLVMVFPPEAVKALNSPQSQQ